MEIQHLSLNTASNLKHKKNGYLTNSFANKPQNLDLNYQRNLNHRPIKEGQRNKALNLMQMLVRVYVVFLQEAHVIVNGEVQKQSQCTIR